jgi:phage FluMu protein Com
MINARLDGNAASGILAEFFKPEMTAAVITCAHCGSSRMTGDLLAYLQAPGLVLRCASCDAVLIRVVKAPARAWLDVSGVRLVEIALPSEQAGARS